MRAVLLFLARRVLQSIPIILGIATFNFVLLHMAPGDAADVMIGEAGSATPEFVAAIRHQFGLDQPLSVQFGRYLMNVITLDLGYSFRHAMPVADLIVSRLGPTLLLMGLAVITAVLLGVVLGVTSARYVNGWPDSLISVLALLAYATPIFWIGLMFIVLFSVQLGWLPSGGMESMGLERSGLTRVADILRHLILPATTLSLFYTAMYARLMRGSMLEVYRLDFVTTARAKGLSERKVAFRHVLRNALLPIITMVGLQTGSLLGGAILVETVFGWPGLGRLAFESVLSRDYATLLGILFLSSGLVVVANMSVDLLSAWFDPRVELR
jgi:peptide/nickel transport system permease protein